LLLLSLLSFQDELRWVGRPPPPLLHPPLPESEFDELHVLFRFVVSRLSVLLADILSIKFNAVLA
jgi:hypothetical protein